MVSTHQRRSIAGITIRQRLIRLFYILENLFCFTPSTGVNLIRMMHQGYPSVPFCATTNLSPDMPCESRRSLRSSQHRATHKDPVNFLVRPFLVESAGYRERGYLIYGARKQSEEEGRFRKAKSCRGRTKFQEQKGSVGAPNPRRSLFIEKEVSTVSVLDYSQMSKSLQKGERS